MSGWGRKRVGGNLVGLPPDRLERTQFRQPTRDRSGICSHSWCLLRRRYLGCARLLTATHSQRESDDSKHRDFHRIQFTCQRRGRFSMFVVEDSWPFCQVTFFTTLPLVINDSAQPRTAKRPFALSGKPVAMSLAPRLKL